MSLSLIILIGLFIAFILLVIRHPNLSCFGRRLRSPFYPLRRRKILAAREKNKIKTEDYGFRLVEEEKKPGPTGLGDKAAEAVPPEEKKQGEAGKPHRPAKKPKKIDDYGFKLD